MSRRERAKAAWDRWPGTAQFSIRPPERAVFLSGYEEGERDTWKRVHEALQVEAQTYRLNGEITPYIRDWLAWVELQLK